MAVAEIWSDLHQRFVVDAQGAIQKVINIDAIVASIDNIVRTRQGERVMLPQFGAGLGDLVFENMDETLFDIITDGIRDAINKWDDRVIVNEISYAAEQDQGGLHVRMLFSVKGYEDIFEYGATLIGE